MAKKNPKPEKNNPNKPGVAGQSNSPTSATPATPASPGDMGNSAGQGSWGNVAKPAAPGTAGTPGSPVNGNPANNKSSNLGSSQAGMIGQPTQLNQDSSFSAPQNTLENKPPNPAVNTLENATGKQPSGVRSRFEKTKSALTDEHSNGAREGYLTHIDPMSAFKVGFVFNLAIFAIWVVAMILLWIILNVAGVWDRLNSLAGDLAEGEFSAGLYFTAVFGLGLFELVIFTLLAPVGAIIFNSAASLFGGLRIGLGDGSSPASLANQPTQPTDAPTTQPATQATTKQASPKTAQETK